MASTFTEALLLLNKWRSESTSVVMLQAVTCPIAGGSAGVLSRMTGRISFIEDGTGLFTFVSPNEDFSIVSPAGCEYGYNAQFTFPPNLAKLVPKSEDSMLCILFPNDTRLMIFEV